MQRYFTEAVIPTDGVYITKTNHPKGFYVARYDAEGLTSQPSWFETATAAENYARQLDGEHAH